MAEDIEHILEAIREKFSEKPMEFPPPAGSATGRDYKVIETLILALIKAQTAQFLTKDQIVDLIAEKLEPTGIILTKEKNNTAEVGAAIRGAIEWREMVHSAVRKGATSFMYTIIMAVLFWLATKFGLKLPTLPGVG